MNKEKLIKCSFCNRTKNDIKILVSGINGNICNFCIEKTYSIFKKKYNINENYYKYNGNGDIIRDYKQIKIDYYKDNQCFKIYDYHECCKKNFFYDNFIEKNLYRQEKNNYYNSVINPKIKKPKDIKKFLDEYVIGQDQAKKIISVSVYNHNKRVKYSLYKEFNNSNLQIEKSNILLIGATGTGKTLLAKSISKFLKVPFAMIDATSLTEAGYVGEDVESILTRLLQASNYDINLAEKGIIFLDELDKISRKNSNATRDISGEGVQQALLKILEGSIIYIPQPQSSKKHIDQKMIPINTENILFIAGGTFDGIEKIIYDRIDNDITIGFKSKIKNTNIENINKRKNCLEYITVDDLKNFGLIPELIGRFPIITYLNPLDRNILKKILIEPKNSLIKQYIKLFEMDDINLNITNDALDCIVEKSLNMGIGARGLRSFCEKIFLDYIFNIEKLQQNKLKIDKDTIIKILS